MYSDLSSSDFKVGSYKLTVVGSGYVGMSLAVLLSQNNEVIVHDIDKKRVDKINSKTSTISDHDIESFLSNKSLSIKATLDKELAYKDADYIIIATPTDYDEIKNKFDTNSVDTVISDILNINTHCSIVIKSTIPVGHTEHLRKIHNTKRIFFSPEFLREGKALHDNLFPSRIIVGSSSKEGKIFADILTQSSKKDEIQTLFVSSTEAESIKLFANTYLALRVSFFNELDSYALTNKLDSKNIIDGICLDERINQGYNNPSFGYGGYCLPKDTKQLLSNFKDIPQALIKAVVDSNEKRKDFIAEEIIKISPKVVGLYRLIMKSGSDNFRSSAIQGIMERLIKSGIKIIIFEPNIRDDNFSEAKVIKSLDHFKNESDLIILNRYDKSLDDVKHKCFSRDIYGEN